MKRKKFFTLLFLLPIFLVGCDEKVSSAISSGISLASNTVTSSSSSEEISSSETNHGDSSSSTSGTSEGEDVGSIDPANSPWNEEITKKMMEVLGGNVIPYIDLGKGNIDVETNINDEDDNYRSSLFLTGGKFLSSSLQNAITEYEKHKWEVVNINDGFYAKNTKLNLSVIAKPNSSNLITLQAWYSEPFDPTTVTDWDEVTKAKIKEYFGVFEVPFVYLGTKDYKVAYSEIEGLMIVTGGLFDDKVYDVFKKTYESKGFEVGTKEDDVTTLIAKKKYGESELSVTLYKENNKAKINVSINEAFDANNQTSWPTAVNKELGVVLNNETFPYIYLGTTYPVVDTSATNFRQLVVKGKIWNDSIITSVKAKLTDPLVGWTVDADSETDSSISLSKVTDSSTFHVTVEKVKGLVTADVDSPKMTIKKIEKYDSSKATDYTQGVKDGFKKAFNEDISNVLKFVYLGTVSPVFSSASTKYDNIYNLVGGAYDDRILADFDSKFNAENSYLVANKKGTSYSSSQIILRNVLKNVNGATYQIALIYVNDDFKTVRLEIIKSIDIKKNSDWSDAAKEVFKSVLGDDIVVPYFETNAGGVEAELYSYTNSVKFNFMPGNSLASIIYGIYTAFDTAKDDYQIDLIYDPSFSTYDGEAFLNGLNATTTLADGRELKFNFTFSSAYDTRYSITAYASIVEKYDFANNKETSWPSNVTDAIKKKFGDIDVPYVYLGTKYPTVQINDKAFYEYEKFKIVGNGNSETFYTDVQTTLKDKGFTFKKSYSQLVATKTTSSDILTLTFGVNNSHPYMGISYSEGIDPKEYTSYSDEIKAALNKNMNNNEVPVIYLGTKNPTFTEKSIYGGTTNLVQIVGSEFKKELYPILFDDFKSRNLIDEWHMKYGGSDTYPEITGYKILDDDTVIRFTIGSTYFSSKGYKNTVDFYYDKKIDTLNADPDSWESMDQDGASEEDKSSNKIKKMFKNETLDPFIYSDSSITSKTPTFTFPNDLTKTNSYVRVKSEDAHFSGYMLMKSKKTLESKGYTVTYNPFSKYSSYGYLPQITFTKKTAKGSTINGVLTSSGTGNTSKNGYDATIYYLPSYSFFTQTDWSSATKEKLTSTFGTLPIPYVNLGVDEVSIADLYNIGLKLVAYNYKADIISDIFAVFEKSGWDMSYVIDCNYGDPRKKAYGYIKYEDKEYGMLIETRTYDLGYSYVSLSIYKA